jgi:hypothetical protein
MRNGTWNLIAELFAFALMVASVFNEAPDSTNQLVAAAILFVLTSREQIIKAIKSESKDSRDN